MGPVHSVFCIKIEAAIDRMVHGAINDEFLEENIPQLQKIGSDHMEVFRTFFPSGAVTDVIPLKNDGVQDARPVWVRLRHYAQEYYNFIPEVL